MTPAPDDIRAHLDWLVEPVRVGAFDDALIEIAHDTPFARGPVAARLFKIDAIEDAVSYAVTQNERGFNVYVGASLKQPETDPVRRTTGGDYYVATAIPIDIDHDYDAVRSRMAAVVEDQLTVITGTIPERRSQHWVRLVEPCDDSVEFQEAFAALVLHVGADAKVKDSARVMRLAGTVSYPSETKQQRGYQVETTRLSLARHAKAAGIERIRALPALEGAPAASHAPGARPHLGTGQEIVKSAFGRIIDGREGYWTKLVFGIIASYQTEHGADPSAAEIWNEAWPTFCTKADLSDGVWSSEAGQKDLRKRIRNTLRRLRDGHLGRFSIASIETGAGAEEAEKAKAKRDRIAPAIVSPDVSRETPAAGLVALPFVLPDPATIPMRQWLYGRHLIRRFVSATIAPGGVGKSTLKVAEALAMATGRPLLGESVERPLRVWLWNLEDPQEETTRKIAAACKAHGISNEDLGGRLFVNSGRDTPLILADALPNGGVMFTPQAEQFRGEMQRLQIDVAIVDPFVSSHHLNENDNNQMDAVVKEWGRIAGDCNAGIDLVHHTRKLGDSVVSAEAARGGKALVDAARDVVVLNAMTEEEAERLNVQTGRRSIFRLGSDKSNMAPPPEKSTWIRIEGIPLGNGFGGGDHVGAARLWEAPSPFDGVSPETVQHALDMIAEGPIGESGMPTGERWTRHNRGGSKRCILQPLAALLGSSEEHAKRVIGEWINHGVVEEVQTDMKGKVVTGLVVNTAARADMGYVRDVR